MKRHAPAGADRLFLGDCLEVLRRLPDEHVDLVYVDPPFFSQRDHAGEPGGFGDRWRTLDGYVAWLVERLAEARRVLRATGALYVHLDWHASHYVKVELDRVFGYERFRNEIFWRRDVAGKGAKRVASQWPRNVDTILVYSKSEKWVFEGPTKELTLEQARAYRHREPGGRRFKAVQLGDYTEASIARLAREGRIHVSRTGKRYKKYYLDEARSLVDGIWTDVPGFGTRTAARERLGWPTQKPEALLERIVLASSAPGAVVADFFCGSGTTLAVARRLGRRFVGCDASPEAIALAAERLGGEGFSLERVEPGETGRPLRGPGRARTRPS